MSEFGDFLDEIFDSTIVCATIVGGLMLVGLAFLALDAWMIYTMILTDAVMKFLA